MNNLIYSTISFIVALFFVVFGTFLLTLPWLEYVREQIIWFIDNSSWMMSFLGIGFLAVGAAIIVYIVLSSKKRHYYLTKGVHSVAVEQKVINQYIEMLLRGLFPEQDVAHQLIIRKNKILITADLPYVPLKDQESFNERINEEIGKILSDKIGYSKQFNLCLSYSSDKKES